MDSRPLTCRLTLTSVAYDADQARAGVGVGELALIAFVGIGTIGAALVGGLLGFVLFLAHCPRRVLRRRGAGQLEAVGFGAGIGLRHAWSSLKRQGRRFFA